MAWGDLIQVSEKFRVNFSLEEILSGNFSAFTAILYWQLEFVHITQRIFQGM